MLRNVCVILMDLQLHSKLALVTASTGGIGKEIAISLVREGATVIINGRTADSVAGAAADIRARVPGAKLKSLVADNGTAEGRAQNRRIAFTAGTGEGTANEDGSGDADGSE